ncbi:hypothetical protein OG693_39510 (plasmid) [Streptomyces sp. NBC_01259]|uniref:hypothetical protein n=1 Tax=Streptomyces sp. NBC_01259 TaxID=2903800 RepID=UPI002F90C5F8
MSQLSIDQTRQRTAPSAAFTTPDIRPSGTAGLPATDEQYEVLDMRQVQEELAAALRHIEGLPHRYPYAASGYVGDPVYQSIPPTTHSHTRDGNTNANTNTNLGHHTPISPPTP